MRIEKIAPIAAAILLIAVLFSGIVIVLPATLPAAAQSSSVLSFQSGPFIGSKNSDVYHYPSCYHVNAIKQQNRVTFSTVQQACAAGYRPCKDCNPPPCGTPTAAPTPTPVVAPTTQQQIKSSQTPTPTPTPTLTPSPTETSPSTSTVAQSSPTSTVAQPSSQQQSSSGTPGFEAVYALVALVAVFLMLRIAKRL